MTKGPCKFHLLQGACSSPVVCSAPLLECPVVYRVTGCGACVPDAMQHGRSVVHRDQSAPLPTLPLVVSRHRPNALLETPELAQQHFAYSQQRIGDDLQIRMLADQLLDPFGKIG